MKQSAYNPVYCTARCFSLVVKIMKAASIMSCIYIYALYFLCPPLIWLLQRYARTNILFLTLSELRNFAINLTLRTQVLYA